jgi:ATPase family associated with various cellular activities (AAA)
VEEIDFDSLCAERDALRNFVLVHASSLRAFEEKGKPWFRRQEPPDTPDTTKAARTIRHLTTTASCLQSLSDIPLYRTKSPPPPCPRNRDEISELLGKKTEEFTTRLFEADAEEWKTEGEDLVYTRVRTLPIVLRLAPAATLKSFEPRIKDLVEGVWISLKISEPKAQAIGESPSDGEGYPPNAFHTYWGIRMLREYRCRKLLPLPAGLDQKEAVARLWSRHTLATQTALIATGHEAVDAQQLAWALSTDVLCRSAIPDQPTTTDHQHAELYEAALAAFFSEQREGRWRLYEPLFHYKKAGNAYCYAYETLAELLRLALQKKHGRILRERLKPYWKNLVSAWHHARKTALDLDAERGAIGWSSGHHPHRTAPEAWATASVFSYLQHLRCLLGYWAAEEAKLSLSVKLSDGGAKAAGLEALSDRGETWARTGTQTVGRQLAMLFLHPLEAAKDREKDDFIDPDEPLVEESRSAVLFGPPGGSKTSIVFGLANALGWDYVEVLASDFLSKGMDSVPESADTIFKRIMELDHCVILFDEIDELIRLRGGDGSDPFGRFLTTSMLPKLAKLWDQRRVLFFVATNDIAAADPAIKRSQRFDAAIFVPPPSFEKKRDRLEEILKRPVPELDRAVIEKALAGDGDEETAVLGVFAFLRWDQIDGLANRIEVLDREHCENSLTSALNEVGVALSRTDWRTEPVEDSAVSAPAVLFAPMFSRWRDQALDERRDYRAKAAIKLDGDLAGALPSNWRRFGETNVYVVLDPEVETALSLDESGALKLRTDSWTALDEDGLLVFKAG